jgi:hypothetical protein
MNDLQKLHGSDTVRTRVGYFSQVFEPNQETPRIQPENFVYFDRGTGTFRKRKINRMTVSEVFP